MTELVENGATILHVLAENPDLLSGIDSERIGNFYKARGEALKTYRAYQQSDKFSWCLIAVPSAHQGVPGCAGIRTSRQIVGCHLPHRECGSG